MTAVVHVGRFGDRTVGVVHRCDRGFVRADTYTVTADWSSDLGRTEPAPIHCADRTDTSPAHSTYDAACAWCWLGYAHTTNEHARSLSQSRA